MRIHNISVLLKNILLLMRPKQYIKNSLVFAPIFFSFQFSNSSKILTVISVFIAFCIASSSVYVLNDIFDIEEDIAHPVKKHRPLASGLVSKNLAYSLSILLFLLSSLISFSISEKVCLIICLYFLLNLAYSIKLKHIPIIDVVIISIGFVMRVVAGGVAISVDITMWIIIITFLLSMFLAIAKRRDDVVLAQDGMKTRKNIDAYNLEFINSSLVLVVGIITMSYIQYTLSIEIQHKFGTNKLYFTTLFVLIGFLRYLQIVFVNRKNGDPTEVLWSDRFLQLIIVAWLVSFYWLVKIWR